MPFKNKNRRFKDHSIVRLFVAVFLFVGVVSVLSFLSRFVFAAPYTEVIKSIELTSQRSSYSSNTPGSWHVTKSAEWIDEGKARITFDVDTIRKTADGTYTDIVMVIDNSGSMSGDKMTQVKSDATELINSVLSNTNNKIALVSFNTTATKLSGFTNNKTNLVSLVNNLDTPGCTNYYDGFKKAEEILEGYQKQNNRELIMLFLTDGYPNEDNPNEVTEYRALKQAYPYMTINGIQYEMGDEILEPIANVSDNQFIANISSLNNILFEASVAPYVYENFTITDYIDNAYWDVESIDDISASIGDIDLTYDGATPKVTWTMNEALVSGKSAQLTIDVTLKDNLNLPDSSFIPTNKSETITSELPETPDEDVSSTLTPVLKTTFDVTYEPNLPSGCSSYTGTLPSEQSYNAFSVVQMSTNKISCNGYNFKGWEIADGDPKILNDDYFKIIGDDVTIRATWSKVSIAKAMDGEVHEEVIATLATGEKINTSFKQLSGQSNPSASTVNTTITAVKTADSMSSAQQANAQIISDAKSAAPIYAWFDNSDGTIYIYSDADIIETGTSLMDVFWNFTSLSDVSGISEWNTSKLEQLEWAFTDTKLSSLEVLDKWDFSGLKNVSGAFADMENLVNIDVLSTWDTSEMSYFTSLFRDATNLTDISALSNWDTINITNMRELFRGTSIASLDALSNWDTSSVKSMEHMFSYNSSLSDISALSNWDTSSVTGMTSMFNSASSLTNIDALSNWDTSNVAYFVSMFNGTAITNLDALSSWDMSSAISIGNMFSSTTNLVDIDGVSNWDISSVASISSIFQIASSLSDISGVANWDTSNVTNMSSAFSNTKITNVDALSNWNVSNVTNMSRMFWVTKLTNVDGLSNWSTSSLTNMEGMFYQANGLGNIDGLSGWDVSNVTTMNGTFAQTIITSMSPLSNWDTSSVTDMSIMFWGYKGTDLSGLDNWSTSNVINMYRMFRNSNNLENIDNIAGWDVSNVTNMSGMFYYDSQIVDLSSLNSWNTSSVSNMTEIFYNVPASVTRPTWYNGT